MLFRQVSSFLLAVAIIAGGCKPAPKAVRAADANGSPRPASTGQTPVAGSSAPPMTFTIEEPNVAAGKPPTGRGTQAPASLPAPPSKPQTPAPAAAAAGEPNETSSSFNSRFEPVLSIYVDAEGRVDYTRLRRMRLLFAPLLQDLSRLEPAEYDSWPVQEKIAFWINVYNVCTLKVVADNYPIKALPYKMLFYPANSIMQIDRPWSVPKFSVMGVEYSLGEIEQRILLNQFDEPRVAFALSYASRWSPRLRNRPYYGKELDKQLDSQTREFITSGNGFRIDKSAETVYLSVLFKETRFPPGFVEKYGSDRRFDDDRAEIRAMLSFISLYLERAEVDYLTGKKYAVSYMKPDWSLNDQ